MPLHGFDEFAVAALVEVDAAATITHQEAIEVVQRPELDDLILLIQEETAVDLLDTSRVDVEE